MEVIPVARLQSRTYVLRLSSWAFGFWWLTVVIMHAVLGAFYFSLFEFHKDLIRIRAQMDQWDVIAPEDFLYQDMLFKLDSDSKLYFRPVMIAAVIVTAGHSVEILVTVGQSLYNRQLCFHHGGGMSAFSSVRTIQNWVSTFHTCSPSSPRFSHVFRSWWRYIRRIIFPLRRNMNRLGRMYHSHSLTVVLVLEIVEVVCQTAQAYRMSYYVSAVWLNRVFALTTVANCWSTPCIHVLCHRHPALERVLGMVADVLFSGLQTVLIPWYVLYPYFRDSDRHSMAISETPFISSLLNFQLDDNIKQLFPSTWLSFLAIVIPGFAMLGYMSAIKRSLARHRSSIVLTAKPAGFSRQKVDATPMGPRLIGHSNEGLFEALGPSTGPFLTTGAGSIPQNPVLKRPNVVKKPVTPKVIHSLLFVWGIVVLGCHYYAIHIGNQAEAAGCVFQLRRWWTSEYFCSMVNVSCAENHIQGFRNELDSILSRMAPLSIQEFVISDCPELEMPRRIQNFTNLSVFVVFNSTIASWEMDAALTFEAHPSILSLSFVKTNMSVVPPSILHVDLPFTLSDLAFSGTNLTSFPDDIDLYWGILFRLCLEASPGITEIPSAISRMFWLLQVSFIDNGIAFIPYDTFIDNAFSELQLSGNPLNTLPTTLGANNGFDFISIERTNITEIPAEWLGLYTETHGWAIQAGGTPLCDRLNNGDPVITGNDSVVVVWFPVLEAWCIDKLRIFCEVFPIVPLFGNQPAL